MIWQFHAHSIYFGENHRGPSTFYTCLGWSVWIWPNAGCKSIPFWAVHDVIPSSSWGKHVPDAKLGKPNRQMWLSKLLMTSPSVAPTGLTWVWSCAPVPDCNMNRKGKDSWRRILGFKCFWYVYMNRLSTHYQRMWDKKEMGAGRLTNILGRFLPSVLRIDWDGFKWEDKNKNVKRLPAVTLQSTLSLMRNN